MSLSLKSAILLLALCACDRDRELLEHDLAAAQHYLGELERTEDKSFTGDLDALERDVDRRLPDGPRGAFTATIAAFLRSIPQAELDGTLEPATNGHVMTDPVEVTLPRSLAHVV